MLNRTLYKREMRSSIKLLLIFAAIMTMYISLIITMYNPDMMKMLDGIVEMMPELMSAVGMSVGATSLLGFMISYLYGFILILFPMTFCILRGNGLIAKHVDRGSMVTLTAAPIKRSTIVLTQMSVIISGILLLITYVTVLELLVSEIFFSGELLIGELLRLNASLLCLHLFIGGICFLCSCIFSDTKYSLAFGAGIPAFMYILQMLANVGDKTEKLRYLTFFTLFNPTNMVAKESSAIYGAFVLLIGAILLFGAGATVFCKKDLHI